MKVVYLGPPGTFTTKATAKMFPDARVSDRQPIRNVILSVELGEFDIGVVPIENFYNGQVNDTLDTLIECKDAGIVREDWLEVVHCIGALKDHGKITRVMSKDQALGQCSQYLSANFPDAELVQVSSTGEAAKLIAKGNLINAAAIASESSLMSPGETLPSLEVLAKDICPNNRTRFFAISRYQTQPTGKDKTFLAVHPPTRDRAGVLNDITACFAIPGINLEYIQSRPDGKKGYRFYIEFDGHYADKNIIQALALMKTSLDPHDKHPDTVKVLGSYANSHWKD